MTDAPARGPYAKSAARRSEIIATATAVFGTHGYRGGSLRQIAKQLDLSLTTVMHHFPTKVSLLAAVLSQEDAADTDFLERSARDGFIPTVLAIVERNIARRELVRMFTVVQAEATHADHEAHEWLRQRYASVIPDYRDAIEHDRAAGRLTTTPTRRCSPTRDRHVGGHPGAVARRRHGPRRRDARRTGRSAQAEGVSRGSIIVIPAGEAESMTGSSSAACSSDTVRSMRSCGRSVPRAMSSSIPG